MRLLVFFVYALSHQSRFVTRLLQKCWMNFELFLANGLAGNLSLLVRQMFNPISHEIE